MVLFYTQLNVKTVLFQTIQFSISTPLKRQKHFHLRRFSWAQVNSLVLFIPQIGSYQVLQLWARVDLGAMVMKEYSAFPKVPSLPEPHSQIVHWHIPDPRLSNDGVLLFCREAVGVFYSPSRLGKCIYSL